jgi:two-component system, NarL family, sensor kinase
MQEKLSEVVLILVSSTLITLILATLIIVAVIIGQRRKYRHRKELLEMKSNYDQEVLRTQIETQAQILETISRELHDNVGTLISIAMVQLKTPTPDKQSTEETQSLLDESLDLLRDISRSINPDNIRKRGLTQSIQHELERIRKTKQYQTTIRVEGEEFPVNPQAQIIFFRIVQESVNNILKHAQATSINISMHYHDPGMTIRIQDNGKGFLFQPELGDSTSHSGLGNMIKRARLIGGELTISSELYKGTTLSLIWPGDTYPLNTKYHKYGMPIERQIPLPS